MPHYGPAPISREPDATPTYRPAPISQEPDTTPNPLNFVGVADIKARMQHIEHLLKEVMVAGRDYGTIPGCGDKPALLKPGSELLLNLFQLVPQLEIQRRDLPDDHTEFVVITSLIHAPTGKFWGHGVGLCSTLETKYRYRKGGGNRKCPLCGKEAIMKSKPPRVGFWCATFADKGGCGTSFEETDSRIIGQKQGTKIDNDNIADVFNTVLKQAKKRSIVDAALTATGASRYFTQDMDEFEKMLDGIDIDGTEELAKKSAAEPAKPSRNAATGPTLDERIDKQVAWLASKGVGLSTLEAHFGKHRGDWDETQRMAMMDIGNTMYSERCGFDDAIAKLSGRRQTDRAPATATNIQDLRKAVSDIAMTIFPQDDADRILREHGINGIDAIADSKNMSKLKAAHAALVNLKQSKRITVIESPSSAGDATPKDSLL